MIEKNDKKRLFLLVDRYLSHEITAWIFCREYSEYYKLILGGSLLSKEEKNLFSELHSIISKFCDDEDEIKKQAPGFFYTKQELKQAVMATKQMFLGCWQEIFMDFGKFVIDPNGQDYFYEDSSNIPMVILGRFLRSDVGCSVLTYSPPNWQDWVLDDDLGEATCGNITYLEKDGPYISLKDLWPEPEEAPIKLTMLRSQLVHLLDEWQEKVCKKRPKEAIIMHENGEFWIETKN